MSQKFLVPQCFSGILASLLIIGIGTQKAEAAQIVTANRASGNISVIDVGTKQLFDVLLPGTNPEPMYVVQIAGTKEVAVGDRANNQIVFFNQQDYSVAGTAPAGEGVFHMWANPQGTQLWVNNDIENTISVINPQTKQLIQTISIPQDIVNAGGKPHDIVLDNDFAYVTTLLPDTEPTDKLLKFSTSTFVEVDRQDVGKDPHVSLTTLNDLLYVPAQGSNHVEILDRNTLDSVKSPLSIIGAHGAGMAPDGQTFYTTNISGGGLDALWAINTGTNTILGTGVDAPAPTPHNIAITGNGKELYISHSGSTSNLVSFYSLDNQLPTLAGSVNVGGSNPFGIAYVAPVPEPLTILGSGAAIAFGAGFKRKLNKSKSKKS